MTESIVSIGMKYHDDGNSTLAFFNRVEGVNVKEHMCIEYTGNIGIGTSNPSELLDVEGGHISINNSQNNPALIFKNTKYDSSKTSRICSTPSNELSFILNSNEIFRLEKNSLAIKGSNSLVFSDVNSVIEQGSNENLIIRNLISTGKVAFQKDPTELLHVEDGNICIRGNNRGLVFKNNDGSIAASLMNSNGILTGIGSNASSTSSTSNIYNIYNTSNTYNISGTTNQILPLKKFEFQSTTWEYVSQWETTCNLNSKLYINSYVSPYANVSNPYMFRIYDNVLNSNISVISGLSNITPITYILDVPLANVKQNLEVQIKRNSRDDTSCIVVNSAIIRT